MATMAQAAPMVDPGKAGRSYSPTWGKVWQNIIPLLIQGDIKVYMNKDIFYLNWTLQFISIQCTCCYTGSSTCLLKYKVGIIILAFPVYWNKRFQNKVIQPSEVVYGNISGGIDNRDRWFSTVTSSQPNLWSYLKVPTWHGLSPTPEPCHGGAPASAPFQSSPGDSEEQLGWPNPRMEEPWK